MIPLISEQYFSTSIDGNKLRLFFNAWIITIFTALIQPTASLANSSISNQPLLLAKKKSKRKRKVKRHKTKSQNASRIISGSLIYHYLGSGVGVEFEGQMNKYIKFASSLNYTQASLEGNEFRNYEEVYEASARRLKLSFRFFPLSFLYISLGLNATYINGDYGFKPKDNENESIDIPFINQVVHGDLSMGFQWQVENKFTIGTEVVGTSSSLADELKHTPNEQQEQAIEFLAGENSSNRIRKEIDRQLSIQYLTLSLGYNL